VTIDELLSLIRAATAAGQLPSRDDLAGDLLAVASLLGSPDPGDDPDTGETSF
jgi:hypothetical protein